MIVRRAWPNWGWGYSPSGDGPFPTILLLHGSEGAASGWSYRNAALFAARGFLAIPFGYAKDGNAWNATAEAENRHCDLLTDFYTRHLRQSALLE